MNIREASKLVLSFAKVLVPPFGFEYADPICFKRKYEEAEVSINFETRKASTTEVALSCTVFFRYYRFDELFEGTARQKDHFFVPIHVINRGLRVPYEWRFASTNEFSVIGGAIESLISGVVIEFVAGNCTLGSLYRRVLSDRPSDWLTLDKTDRVIMIGACMWAQDEKREAIEYLQNCLDQLTGSLPKFTTPIEFILRRMKGLQHG